MVNKNVYKIGDKVRLIKNIYGMEKGTVGVIEEFFSNIGGNGAGIRFKFRTGTGVEYFYFFRIEPVINVGEQLEFPFMETQ